MFETLFGADVPLAVKFFLAFVIVLGLIGGTAWAVRRFGGSRLGSSAARGRQPRLAVIDAAAVDGRRRLVLIRRDNVEHLLMIGGPSDVVVEANIVRAAGAPREVHGTVPTRAPADTLPRPVPLAEGSMGPPQPEPAPPPRPPRPAPSEQPVPWPMPQAVNPARVPQRPVNTLVGLADELSARPAPAREPPPAPRPEPPRPQASAPMPMEAAAAPPQGDQNLAEMAQRLEAALRRPAQPGRGRSAPAAKPAPVAEEPPAGAPVQQHAPAPPAQAEPAEAAEAKPGRSEAKSGKALYESLEQEMASLLGRPQQEKG